MANYEAEARKIRRKLKEPIQFAKGEEHLITRKEKQVRKMQKIDRKYHKEINNRKVQRESVLKYRMHVGLASGLGNGDKDLQEIADLEDECVVKLNDMTYDNQRRKNVPLSTQQARYQSNTLDRIHS